MSTEDPRLKFINPEENARAGEAVKRATSKDDEDRAALAGVGFNILLLGFIAQWFEFFPDGITGSILRLSVMSLALAFFVVGVAGALCKE